MRSLNRKKLKQHLKEINVRTAFLYLQDKSEEANIAAECWLRCKINESNNLILKMEKKLKYDFDRFYKSGIEKLNLYPIVIYTACIIEDGFIHFTITPDDICRSLLKRQIHRSHIKIIKFCVDDRLDMDQHTFSKSTKEYYHNKVFCEAFIVVSYENTRYHNKINIVLYDNKSLLEEEEMDRIDWLRENGRFLCLKEPKNIMMK